MNDEELGILLDRAVYYHPLIEHERNDNYMYIGRKARREGCTLPDMNELIRIAAQRYSDDEYNYKRIYECIMWGYNNAGNYCQDNSDFARPQGRKATYNAFISEGVDTKNANRGSNILEQGFDENSIPYFSEIPPTSFLPIFQDFFKWAKHPSDVAALVTSMCCVFSSVLAGTRIRMGHNTYSPHLFFILLGLPGAGKSIIEHALGMLRDVILKYKMKYQVAKNEYDRKVEAWELEKKNASNDKRVPNDALYPGEAPKYYAFHMPDTISRSKLLENTEAGAKYGGMMSGSEIDGLSSSVKKDTGQHDSVLRAMAMNERIGQFYKSNTTEVVIDFPMCAVQFAGTPNQIIKFMPTATDGFLSRTGWLYKVSNWQWQDLTNEDAEGNIDKEFEALAPYVLGLHEFSLNHPCIIRLTDNQLKRFNRHYRTQFAKLFVEEHPENHSIVVRNAVLLHRFCAIFSMLRKYDANDKSAVYYCCDEDFNTALAMAKVFMEHTLLVATILPGEKVKPKDMTDPHRYLNVLKALPEEFSREQFKTEYMKYHNAGRTTITKRLEAFVKAGFVERVQKDYYKKTSIMSQLEKDYIDKHMCEIRGGK